jgi:predicted RNA binding protein YcfA (HicA-like mRNA interferase family)
MKYSELEKILRPKGCKLYRKGGRHPIWYSPITGMKFAMSYHKNEEVPSGTLKDISIKSGVKV